VSPERPTFLPLPATQLAPLAHWLLAVQTPSPLAQGQSSEHARSAAVLQTGLSTHTTSLVVVPATDCFWFAPHVFQALQVAALTWVLNVPLLQAAHWRSLVVVGAAVWRLPGWQLFTSLHFRSDVAVAGVDSYWLELQTVSAVQVPFFSYFPAPQVEQIRSDVALGGTLSLSPDLHCDQAVQVAALRPPLKVPLSHGLHARSA
jgi:hypothetical protein